MEPDLLERTDGGWLAVAPVASNLRIAVEGATREEAEEHFAAECAAWESLREAADRRAEQSALG